MRTECPAKLNLFLTVGSPDPSGYHPVRSVMQTVSLCDLLEADRAHEERFFCDVAEFQTGNTVMKAVRLAREYVSFPDFEFRLTKRVPSQAGLGGGSSDAAGAIRLVAQASRGQLGEREQLEIATAVGMDVPFFLLGGRAKVSGYGEKVTTIVGIDPRAFLVVMPKAKVETKSAYQRLDDAPRDFLEFPSDLRQLHNDFLTVAPKECLDMVLRLREAGAEQVSLTGSGAAVFAAFESESHAMGVHVKLESGQAWVCRPLTREESTWIS